MCVCVCACVCVCVCVCACVCVWPQWPRLFALLAAGGGCDSRFYAMTRTSKLLERSGHLAMWPTIRALNSTEVLMSDLSCTRTLVALGWLHTWEIPNRTQTQGLRRTSEPRIGKFCVTKVAARRLIGPDKRNHASYHPTIEFRLATRYIIVQLSV